ncbi:MAG: DUF3842 family protein [Spirochaetales bacterium]|nr:DUF3842 family protein [Spirochaetales bacterium]MBO7348775.1 DUF3842 family protein [Spirochaetales bacterium]MBP5756065.1 DUF3842 family protein [Spirochaetales bacterium]
MKIVVIDGQGGKIGKTIIEQLKAADSTSEVIAIGTNALATAAMLKAGADNGATGENPVVLASRTADVIVGPIGIIAADSMLGEITPKMAEAIGQSSAKKVLIPVSKCFEVAGVQPMPLSQYVTEAVQIILG